MLASVLPTAIGIAGAVHGQPLATTLTDAVIAVLVLDLGYAALLVLSPIPDRWSASRQ